MYYKIEPHVDSLKSLKQVIDICYSKKIYTLVVDPQLITPAMELLCQKGYKMKIGTSVGNDGFAEGINKYEHVVGDIFEADYYEIHTMLASGLRMIKDLTDATNIIRNAVSNNKEICWVFNNISPTIVQDLVSNVNSYIKPDVVCINTTNIDKNHSMVTELGSKLHVKTKLMVDDIDLMEQYPVDYYGISLKATLQMNKTANKPAVS